MQFQDERTPTFYKSQRKALQSTLATKKQRPSMFSSIDGLCFLGCAGFDLTVKTRLVGEKRASYGAVRGERLTSTGCYVPLASAALNILPFGNKLLSFHWLLRAIGQCNAITHIEPELELNFHWLLRAIGQCNREKYRLLMSYSIPKEPIFFETPILLTKGFKLRM